jgi:hypothetical protein
VARIGEARRQPRRCEGLRRHRPGKQQPRPSDELAVTHSDPCSGLVPSGSPCCRTACSFLRDGESISDGLASPVRRLFR